MKKSHYYLFKTPPSDSRSSQRSSYMPVRTYELVFLLFLLLPSHQGAGNHPTAGTFSANAPSLMGIWHLPRTWYVQFLPFMHQTQNQCSGLGSGGIGTMGGHPSFQLSLSSMFSFLVPAQNLRSLFQSALHTQTHQQTKTLSLSAHITVFPSWSPGQQLSKQWDPSESYWNEKPHYVLTHKCNFPKVGEKCISNTIHEKCVSKPT